jgi:hypothetical protein
MTTAKTIYTAEPRKFFVRIWRGMMWSLALCAVFIGVMGFSAWDMNAVIFGCIFLFFFPGLLGYIGQYKYRFIQAISIMEEDGEFVFELLYKDELYAHVIKKSNISTKLELEDLRSYIFALTVFDGEEEVFVLYSGSGVKEADLKKIKDGLGG